MNNVSRQFLMILVGWALVASAAFSVPTFSQVASATTVNHELSGGWWFDGRAFVRKKFYVVNGTFTEKRPKRVDNRIDLGDLYVVPAFGDAHTHGFDNPNDIQKVVATNLRDGIFYALSLANSIRGKRSVAAFVNKPSSMDVAYANAVLTATLGHPILSAEVTANRIPWDQLGKHWQQLLKSHTAEGDVYFVIDDAADLKRKWPAIIGSKPDVIKIILLDTEHFEEKKKSTNTIDDKGLNPALVPAIVRRAHRSGVRVVAHVETAADVRVAVAAGVDILAHLPGLAPKAHESPARYELTESDARVMARKGITVIATAWLAERLAAPKPWLSGAEAMADVAQLERAKKIQRAGLNLLKSHGVRIAIGADLFENASREARYLEQLGVFNRQEILDMWSRTTPQLIFPNRRIGRLRVGYEASFVALSCDPTARFECVREIAVRMKNGALVPVPPSDTHSDLGAPNNSGMKERRERLSQLTWCVEGCFDSRRRVNSTVMRLRPSSEYSKVDVGERLEEKQRCKEPISLKMKLETRSDISSRP